jgi:hypothetical protein
MNVLRHVPGYDTYIYDEGKQALFLVLASFLIAFALARLYTRLARIYGWGSGSIGGVHVHHAVPGLVLALTAGMLSFTQWGSGSPQLEVLAILFGVGAALILDEWALIFRLADVYWSKEGRSSIDAVIIGTLLAGILLHTTSPFGVEDAKYAGSRTILFALLALNYLFASVCFLKGKPIAGAVGLLIPLVALVGAVRLAKPNSPWSRSRYNVNHDDGPRRREAKLARARQRYDLGWQGRTERKIADLIGGAPTAEPSHDEEGSSACRGQGNQVHD